MKEAKVTNTREMDHKFIIIENVPARVCGPPIVDREFGSIDFFVVFDVENLSPKYRGMFGQNALCLITFRLSMALFFIMPSRKAVVLKDRLIKWKI